jgi:hypothetical protein
VSGWPGGVESWSARISRGATVHAAPSAQSSTEDASRAVEDERGKGDWQLWPTSTVTCGMVVSGCVRGNLLRLPISGPHDAVTEGRHPRVDRENLNGPRQGRQAGPAKQWNPHAERLTRQARCVSDSRREGGYAGGSAGPRGRRASGPLLRFEPKAPNKSFSFLFPFFHILL